MVLRSLYSLFTTLLIFAPGHAAGLDRSFGAAPKHPSLKRSNGDCTPGLTGHEVVFVEDAIEPLVATVKIDATDPMLILEDLDDHIRNVECSDNELIVEFWDTSKAAEAASLWALHESFVVVTHRTGCQIGNEHTAWNVTRPLYKGKHVSLSASPTTLKEKARHMSVEFGNHLAYKADLRRLLARQASTTDTATLSSSMSPATPTGTVKGAAVTQDIGFSWKDQILIPPPAALASIVNAPGNFSVSCVDCTFEGAITMSAGAFDVDQDGLGVEEFIDSGFVEFEATNIGAHMEFAMQFLPGFESGAEVAARLQPISLSGISIVGLLKFAPKLELIFPMSITLNSTVTFTTGFTVTAPPSLSIYLNISDPLSSEATGWSDASLDTIPFTADTDGLACEFQLGFRPQLKLEVTAGSNGTIEAEASVGVSLELPMLTASVTPLTTATEDCAASPPNETVYQLSPSIGFGALSFIHDFDTQVFSLNTDWDGDDEPVVFHNSTLIPLKAQCLRWDAEAKVLADPDIKKASSDQENGIERLSIDSWKLFGVALMSLFTVMNAM